MIALLARAVEIARCLAGVPSRAVDRVVQVDFAEFLEPVTWPVPPKIVIECTDPVGPARLLRPKCSCDVGYYRDRYFDAQADADRFAAQLVALGHRPAPAPIDDVAAVA